MDTIRAGPPPRHIRSMEGPVTPELLKQHPPVFCYLCAINLQIYDNKLSINRMQDKERAMIKTRHLKPLTSKNTFERFHWCARVAKSLGRAVLAALLAYRNEADRCRQLFLARPKAEVGRSVRELWKRNEGRKRTS